VEGVMNNGKEKRNTMNKCSEVMTQNPVCCLPGDPVKAAALLMKTENIGPIPVVEDERSKKLVGIVTDRDLALKIVADDRDSNTAVEEIMTQDLLTCQPEDNLQTALDLMAEGQVRRIPVVDTDGRLVGIISQADVAMRINAPRKTAELVENVSKSNREN
jgi:CBS domain-containing protein